MMIKQGLNASNLMEVTVSDFSVDDLNATVSMTTSNSAGKSYWTFGCEGVFLGANEPIPIVSHIGASNMDEACVEAIRILNKRVTRRRRQLQGGVFIGEIGKTLSMVFKPAKSLRQKVTVLTSRLAKARKRVADGPTMRKVAADIWLETVFGWKPLIADLKDGAEAVARVVTKDALERQQFRAFGQSIAPQSCTKESFSVSCGTGVSVPYNGVRHVDNLSQCIIYGAFATKLQDAKRSYLALSYLAQLSGLNWEDVPAQVWELIPWSFLVDYFINVGDVLESVGNFRSEISWAMEVHIRETKISRSWTLDEPTLKSTLGSSYLFSSALDGSSISSYKQISRLQFIRDYRSEINFKLPGGLQWLNIAALVAGGKSLQPFSSR
jgi:hypothetical protein